MGAIAAPAHATYSNLSVSPVYAGVNANPVVVTFTTSVAIGSNDQIRVWFPNATGGSWWSGSRAQSTGLSQTGPDLGSGATFSYGNPGNGEAWGQIQAAASVAANTSITFTFAPGTINFANIAGTVEFAIRHNGFDADTGSLAYQLTVPNQTVSFDANGGSGTMVDQLASSSTALTPNTFTRNGYYFDGWNTAANGGGTNFDDEANYDFVANATMYAKWRAIPLTPTAVMSIQVPVGQSIDNAPVALEADGLKVNTGYTVTVHSTPQIIDQGTIWSGRLSTTVQIPAGLEAGWHRLVIEGTAADGTPWVEENYFKVSPGGILLATSEVVPAELAVTGAPDSSGTITLSVVLLSVGLLLSAGAYRLRRRVNQ
jgi:uncharacterized repeat protein (TIGR02543 family)